MIDLRAELHRILLAAILLGNAILFAGVDPPTRAVTAALALVLVVDLPRIPSVPRPHLWAGALLGGLVAAQVVPLPLEIRSTLQPGLEGLIAGGWAPLSVAPWATIQAAVSVVVAAGIAVTAARLAATRSGLPYLLTVLAAVAAVLAVTGLAGEAGAPDRVMLVRANTVGASPYGPYLNRNHFAQGIELSLPAALVLLAVAGRKLPLPGLPRRQATSVALATGIVVAVGAAALLRSGSRGGVVFLAGAAVATMPLWWGPRRSRRWLWVTAGAVLLCLIAALAWARLPALRDDFAQLFVIEGVEGNTRWDLWRGTVQLWRAAPVLGTGLGSYRYVIGVFKPATGSAVLEQAHNDWLEALACGGLAGAAVLVLLVVGCAGMLRPGRLHRIRFELRYPAAGAGLVLVATALHETIGFGLQTPLNRYLLAAWIGMLWGIAGRAMKVGPRLEDG